MVDVVWYRVWVPAGVDAEVKEPVVDRRAEEEGGHADRGGADNGRPQHNRVGNEAVAADRGGPDNRDGKRAQEEDQGEGLLLIVIKVLG